MRQITIDAIRAFRNGNNFKRSNTQVKTYAHSNYREFLLHGNVIADMNENGLFISDGGWQTVTTKERLNGFPNVHIYQKDFQWFLNGEKWDGSRIKV